MGSWTGEGASTTLRLTYHIHPQYGIVLDAGSSHTSMFVYKWPADKENDTGIVGQHSSCDVQGEHGLGFLFGLSFAGPNGYFPLLAARWGSFRTGVQKERLSSQDLGGAVGTSCSRTEALGNRWTPWGLMAQAQSLHYR